MLFAVYNILYDLPIQYLQISITEELSKIIVAKDSNLVSKEFHTMTDNPGKYYVDDREMTGLGYNLLGLKEFAKAIIVFKLNIEAHPMSWNAYDSLGEAYMKNDNSVLAINNYEKSLELNPENTNATKMLEKIKKDGK
ncbi:MAG: tetratricopeptide repeat protein [Flavobacteriales bacterium]|nr:tetratricopeptide repeat protein [Flavobacteriales bacterium]